jgi:hypothetical protein
MQRSRGRARPDGGGCGPDGGLQRRRQGTPAGDHQDGDPGDLLYGAGHHHHFDRASHYHLFHHDDRSVLDLADGEVQPLTADGARAWVSDWSPDGTRIALTSERDGNREIYTLDLTSGELVRIIDEPGLDGIPAWRP